MASSNPSTRGNRFQDLTGRKFGRLIALEYIPRSASSPAKWRCACKCGAEITTAVSCLTTGMTRSCGCLRNEASRKNGLKTMTHGLTRSPEYRAWRSMRCRCYRVTDPSYQWYGGRGISVCQRWRESFLAFLADVGPRPSPRHSVDRIDNDGNYEPANCRWATTREQKANVSWNRHLTYNGETRNISEWARQTGISSSTIRIRLDRLGWTIEDALTTPSTKPR